MTLVLSLFLSAVADSYDSDIIGIHAKVFPKILLGDTRIEDKLANGAIKIIILYSEEDIRVANELKADMLHFYPHVKEYPFQVYLKEYKQFNPAETATAYYELLGDKKEILSVNTSAQKNSRITFSYSSDYLDYGTLMSLYITNKVSLYLSMEALKQSNIVLNSIIYKIARIK